jgi:hypothetical protein
MLSKLSEISNPLLLAMAASWRCWSGLETPWTSTSPWLALNASTMLCIASPSGPVHR